MLRLPTYLLPTAGLSAADAVALYALNPLLQAKHPALCAIRAADVEAARLSQAACYDSASKMVKLRNSLRLALPSSAIADNPEGWQLIYEYQQSGYFTHRDRSTIMAFARRAHHSEWGWLADHLKAVIRARVLAHEEQFLQAA